MSGQDSPVSWIRRCSSPGWRKASSLHERICVPTRSELVASILALSSFRFTPAIEATSLISSSSLKDEMVDGKKIRKYKKNTETRILLWYIFTTHFCRATRRICICPSFTLGKACEISTALQGSLRKLERPLSQFYWLLLEAVFKIFSLLFSSKITRKIHFALSLIVYSRPNITLSTRRFFTGIFAWTKLCISFVTRGLYVAHNGTEVPFQGLFASTLWESGRWRAFGSCVLLGKDAPENWQRAAMNLAID